LERIAGRPTLQAHQELIARFYAALQRHDAAEMVACYYPQVEFSDTIFGHLTGARAVAMWRMLVEWGQDLDLSVRDIRADEHIGSAHWEARYTYTDTGRTVINWVEAQFRFDAGLIRVHQDRFDLWRWAAQALGVSGLLLGWTPAMQQAIRRRAQQTLDAYIAKRGL
jgi:hypothetical protein